jgi:hypothetical protein
MLYSNLTLINASGARFPLCPPARLLTAIKASAPKLYFFGKRQVGNITKNFNSHFVALIVSSGEPKEVMIIFFSTQNG